jgi:hypothetical protein
MGTILVEDEGGRAILIFDTKVHGSDMPGILWSIRYVVSSTGKSAQERSSERKTQ